MTTVAAPELVEILPASADRDEWLAIRKRGLGGTDVAALVGIHPYRTALGVYLDKVTTDTEDDAEDEAAEAADARYWGTVLEAPVADHFARRNQVTLATTGTWARGGWQLASPDRLIHLTSNIDQNIYEDAAVQKPGSSVALYEGKTASAWLHKEWAAGQVPDHYVIQVQWYLHVLGLQRAHVAALIGGQQYVQAEIVRDDKLIDGLVTVAARFWADNVQSLRPPSLAGEPAKAALELLNLMHPVSIDGARVDLDDDFARLLHDWEAEKLQARMHKKRAEELQVLVKEAMADAESAYIGGRLALTATNVAATDVAYTRKAYRLFTVKKDFKP